MENQTIVEALLLGMLEGLTEFIPVSSTGHLILVGDLLNFEDERAKTFEIFIQLGAILAIVWLYRAKFAEVMRGAGKTEEARHFLTNLAIAFMPAAVVGFVAHGWIKEYLFNHGNVHTAMDSFRKDAAHTPSIVQNTANTSQTDDLSSHSLSAMTTGRKRALSNARMLPAVKPTL